MTPKQRILNAIEGKPSDVTPVGIHVWGQYKFALYGIHNDYSEERKAWAIGGAELADIDARFYEQFKPDWLHLTEGPFFDDIKERINAPENAELLKAVRKMDSKQAIDEFLDRIYLSADEFEQGPKFKHIPILVERYGGEVFIALHTEGPIHDIADTDGVLEFEGTFIAMIEKPEMFAYLAREMYQRQLAYVEAVKRSGADCYIQSDSYLYPDLISPDTYERTMHETLVDFYTKVDEMGIISMCYPLGDCAGAIKYIKQWPIKGILPEESKKGMNLDPAQILRDLDYDRAVFGNVDSIGVLLHGDEKTIRTAVQEQIKSCASPNFISGFGSPIPFNTPPENITAFIQAARECRGY